jgi:dTDP-4-dehydrorhamnose reductase
MRVLLFGGSGQVGRALAELAEEAGSFHLVAPPRDTVDLTRPATIASALAARPDIVINTGAYTAVDRAEDEPAMAFAVNRDAPGELARLCAVGGIPLIHLSTDYVFDGAKADPYVESDAPGPLNVYGKSKLEGEIAVRQRHERHIILRCSWIFGRHGGNFVRSILARAVRGENLQVVDDQRGCPTPAAAIARAIFRIAEQAVAGRDFAWGTYHFAGRNPVTWFEFAAAILKCASPWLATVPSLTPIPSSAYPARARRPANSVLDCTLIAKRLGIVTEPWEGALGPAIAGLRSTIN